MDENSALLDYYPANSGHFLPTSRDKLSVPFSGAKNWIFVIPENGTDRMSRNVGNKLPLFAA